MQVRCQILEMDIPGELCGREQGIPECAGCTAPTRRCTACGGTHALADAAQGICADCLARGRTPRPFRPRKAVPRPTPARWRDGQPRAVKLGAREEAAAAWRASSSSAESAQLLAALVMGGRRSADGRVWIGSPVPILAAQGLPEARAKMFLAFCLEHGVIERSSQGWHEIILTVTADIEAAVRTRQAASAAVAEDPSPTLPAALPALPPPAPQEQEMDEPQQPVIDVKTADHDHAPSAPESELLAALADVRETLVALLGAAKSRPARRRARPIAVPLPSAPAFDTDVGFARCDGELYVREDVALRILRCGQAALFRMRARYGVRTLRRPGRRGATAVYYHWHELMEADRQHQR